MEYKGTMIVDGSDMRSVVTNATVNFSDVLRNINLDTDSVNAAPGAPNIDSSLTINRQSSCRQTVWTRLLGCDV
jgi:hypothetical protein